MATAVVQIDVDDVPESVTVADRYATALVVLRRRRHPVAGFYVAVHGGSLDMRRFSFELARTIRVKGGHWKVADYLGAPAPSLRPDCTVAICTRERPEDLTRAIQAALALQPHPQEILVIDNNP